MKKLKPATAIGLVVLAVLILTISIVKFGGFGQSSAADMASLTPKPRANSPSFEHQPGEVVLSGRGAPTGAAQTSDKRGMATTPPPTSEQENQSSNTGQNP
jgi:hypothetical protein